MSSYKPYEKYKDSGVEWLGQIPEHWYLAPIKGFTKTYSEKGKPEFELLSVYRDYGVIIKSSRDDNHNKPGMDLSSYKVVHPNTLVLNKMKTWQGSLGVSKYQGIVSPAYITCTIDLKQVDTAYVNYLLRCYNYIFQYNRLSYGVRPSQWDMRYQDFKNIPTFLPHPDEQTTIARFLDYKTGQIDRFIRKKKQLIKLLNEQKAAIINQAVTKGINPDAPMKNSGIEWLGEIPAHWRVRKLKYVAECFPSNIDKHSKEGEQSVRLCNYTDVYKNDFIINDMSFMVATASDDQIAKFSIRKDDVIITKDSEVANDIAVPALVKEDLDNVVCGYHLSVIRSYGEITGEYLFRLLQSKTINIQFEVYSNGVTRVALGVYDLKKAKIPVPDLQEQNQIGQHINKETEKLYKATAKIEKEITLAEEYRTAIIAEAVTGKIDVRAYKIPETINSDQQYEDIEEELSIAAEDEAEYETQENE